MRAIKYHGVHNLELVDIEKPKAGPGQALVKVELCGICGTDIHAYSLEGVFNWELVLGHEGVGIVEEVGEGVTCVKAGDRVAIGPPGDCGTCYQCNTGHPNICGNAFPNTLGIGPNTQGAYAEYVLSKFPQNELFKIPEGLEMDKAVLFDLLGVGIHAVRRSELKLGDQAVVFGCGSIGLSVVQCAKLAGARTVIAFDPKEVARKRALEAGADYVFDISEEDIAKAKELLTHQGGAHVCFEAAGHPQSTKSCIDLCMAGGQVMIVGSDPRPAEIVSAAMGPMEYDLKFSFTYTKEEIYELFELITSGMFKTDMFSTMKVPLEDAEKMIIEQVQGKIDVARVLLSPDMK
ncbi:MAG: alcohol dehydrogenase catalytic domain-containing protein [Parasporobacterium sp.]|nr:alcohol dehydrogenase catalytic domain-containing protein [Parasporobacterium sp.]